MAQSGQTNDFFKSEDLQALTKARSDQGLLFSLYLDLRPVKPSGNLLDRFNDLLNQLEHRKRLEHAFPEYRQQWAVEADQMRRHLETGHLPQAPGVAVFSSLAAGLWQVIPLPQPVCDQLVAGDRPNIRPLEILMGALKSEQQPKLETQRVEEIISRARKGEGAVLGPEQTFLAVRAKTVRLLVAEEGFCLPGGECPNCGFLGFDDRGVCLLCGVALRPEPDIVEVAQKRVLEAGGEIEILRSAESRRALEQYGRIGGLVHASGKAPVKDTADQRPIAKDGEINHDALQDETIEESFPASDPPGWNH